MLDSFETFEELFDRLLVEAVDANHLDYLAELQIRGIAVFALDGASLYNYVERVLTV